MDLDTARGLIQLVSDVRKSEREDRMAVIDSLLGQAAATTLILQDYQLQSRLTSADPNAKIIGVSNSEEEDIQNPLPEEEEVAP